MEKTSKSGAIIQTSLLGICSAILFFLLYYFEEPIVSWTRQGGGYFIIPVFIAVVFSSIYGTFTSHFWDILGIKAKSLKK